MTHSKLVGSLVLTAMLASTSAQAISFGYTPASGTGQDAAYNSLLGELKTQINSKFSPTMSDKFLQSMADATRGANRGQGTDGSVRGDLYSISASMGASFAASDGFGAMKTGQNQLPGIGVGVQPAVTIGVSAKKFAKWATFGLDPEKVDYFVNFMKADFSDISPEAGFTLTNFGFMGRYWLRDSHAPNWAFRFDGLSLATGIQYSGLSANLKSNLNFTQAAGPVSVSWAPVADFGVEASALTIPLEARTGITLLKFWSLSVGAGVLFNFGGAETVGSIAGPIKDGTTTVSTGTLDMSSTKQKPTLLSGRFSLGNQFNFGPAKLFVDAGYSTPSVADVTAGLRWVW